MQSLGRLTVLLFTADPTSESKEDQWMGVTVQSQGPGGKVVVSVETHVHPILLDCWLHASTRLTAGDKAGSIHSSELTALKQEWMLRRNQARCGG